MSDTQTEIPRTTCGPADQRRHSAPKVLARLTLTLLCCLAAVASGLIPVDAGSLGTLASTAAGSSTAKPNGWGVEKTYLGRYRLLGAATQQVYKGRPATRLGSGELTMFMREEHKGAPLLPSGILDLHGPAPIGAELLYLTSLSHSGNVRHAVINGGSFAGPVVGAFTAVPGSGGKLTVTATVKGLGTLHASFIRFSSSPQP